MQMYQEPSFANNTPEQNSTTKNQYLINRRAPIGTMIQCAHCGRDFLKKQSDAQFCSTQGKSSCKEKYWHSR